VPSTGIDFNQAVGDFETNLIRQALEQTNWNKNRAAGLLGLNRTTLLEKIKKRGVVPTED
jgi:DNA-binding NtrC family response regulator